MYERLEASGQSRHGWPPVLFRIVIALLAIIPAVIQASLGRSTVQARQVPVALREWAQTISPPLPASLKHVKRGMDLYSDERYEAALEAFGDEPVAPTTVLGDYLLFYRAKSYLMLERNRDALAHFQRLENLFPDSPLVRDALVGQCQVLLTLGEPRAVLAVLSHPKMNSNSDALYFQAKALDMAGEKEKAAESFLRIYSRYPTSKYSSQAEQYLVSSSPGAFKGARNYEARLQRAENLIGSGEYRSARLILLGLAKATAPAAASSEKRNLLFGEVEYRQGRTTAAISFVRKVTAENPALHSKALYLEGICLRKLDRAPEFLAVRDRLLKLYPRSGDAEELCYSAATHFDVNYDAARSREAYALLYESFPKGKYAERALWKLAFFSYLERKYGEAALGFWKYLLANPSPSSANAAIYWMGRCFENLNQVEAANYLYRRARELSNESYYGLRAREAEIASAKAAKGSPISAPGIDFDQVVAACNAVQLPAREMADPSPAAVRFIQRARLLVAAGFPNLAATEIRWGRSQCPESDDDALSFVLARIYAGNRDHDAAISALRKAFPDYILRPQNSLPDDIWETLYPVPYFSIVSAQASNNKVDPNLVMGLIRQESAFNEQARSRANARGLMQILPSTGRKLARQAKIRRYSSKKLFEAETNIVLGTKYFAFYLQQYGKPELALAAYNAGDSRVKRWLQEWGNLDIAEFVEQIPFAETRGYVKQVLSNRARYEAMTSSGSRGTP